MGHPYMVVWDIRLPAFRPFRHVIRHPVHADDGLQCFALLRSNIAQELLGLLFEMVEIRFGGQRQQRAKMKTRRRWPGFSSVSIALTLTLRDHIVPRFQFPDYR
jgi:hypothetical protein